MKYGIVFSLNDPAGSGIARKLVGLTKAVKCSKCLNTDYCYCGDEFVLAGFKEDVIYFDFLDEVLSVEQYIVLSRHSSTAGVKSYTVHHTGNPGDQALYGGKPRRLSIASPVVSYSLLRKLYSVSEKYGRLNEYEVSYEATHHGPTELNKPLCFIEIGSSEEEWVQELNHLVIAETVKDVIESQLIECIPVIGIGGGHYPRKHTKIALETNYCYGHIFAKYALEYLDKEILLQAIERSSPRPKGIIVEKKGTKRKHRDLVEDIAKNQGLFIKYV